LKSASKKAQTLLSATPSDLEGLVQGLHHITLVTSNQEVNRRFYTEVLGLRRVKLTVNQDDIFHRHLFYADANGTTGSAITFFEWPDLPKGLVGLTSPHHLAYTTSNLDALPKWRTWLLTHGVHTSGPLVRDDRVSLYLRDPDGVIIEITKPNDDGVTSDYVKELSSEAPSVEEITPDMKLQVFSHASPVTRDLDFIIRFHAKFLGLKNSFKRKNPDHEGTSILGIGNDDKPDFLTYLAAPNAPLGDVGTGSVHHIAMAVESDEDQLRIMRHLSESGIGNSGIVDRFWFKSLYFRDPEGNLLEIATKGPGYTADEPLEMLGTRLVLAPWLEPKRTEIEVALAELDMRNAQSWPPRYPATSRAPESFPN
jgi:glyoxalase family protein